MNSAREKLLAAMPFAILIAVGFTFAALTPKFLEPTNLLNIVAQASSTGILTIGITFVLLTAGVDLSVGAIMFVAAAIAGKITVAGASVAMALPIMLAVGMAFAIFNALFIVRIRVAAFIVTLATLFMGRGLGLLITKTRAINVPDAFLSLNSAQALGLPLPVWVFCLALLLAHLLLTHTAFGRQTLAVGHNVQAAEKAGISSGRIVATVYLISGACAAIAAIITLGQLGAVSPKFGEQKEFAAIAAAVLGGTSLFGGRGNILPGALVGSLLIQTIENGLVLVNANPYLYPMVISGVIFAAIVLESTRNSLGHRRNNAQI